MNTVLPYAQFETDVLSKGTCMQYMIYPFYSNELKEYGKVITFSDKVEKLTFVFCGKEKIGMIMPYRQEDNLYKTIKRYQEEVKSYVGMQVTIFSLYDFDSNKVHDIEFFKEGYWF